MSRKESRREKARQARRQQTLVSVLRGVGVLAVLALAFFAVRWFGQGPARMGEAIPIMASEARLALGEETTYNSNPPTSGEHYDRPMPAGFYDVSSPEATTLHFPEGHIVHSMMHGYVIIWYNCANYSGDCETLLSAIREVIEEDPAEVIAFPWLAMDGPVTLTSYGRLLALDELDPDVIREFIRANRNAPESPEVSLD